MIRKDMFGVSVETDSSAMWSVRAQPRKSHLGKNSRVSEELQAGRKGLC